MEAAIFDDAGTEIDRFPITEQMATDFRSNSDVWQEQEAEQNREERLSVLHDELRSALDATVVDPTVVSSKAAEIALLLTEQRNTGTAV